jgi:CHAD domain
MESVTKNIIARRFKKINRAVRKLEEKFSPARIHAFRLEVKHLNSFLKLLAAGGNTNHEVSMPGRIKKAYRKTGKLRLIQLEKESIRRLANQSDLHEPLHYMIWLETEEQRLQESAEIYFGKMKRLKAGHFIRPLPRKIQRDMIRKFYEAQVVTVRNLVINEKWDEKSLHEARKILKNLIYNGPWIKNVAVKPESSDEQRELLKALESKIGSYHDLCASLRLLPEDKHIGMKDESESTSLLNIRKEWGNEKRALIKEIDHSIPRVAIFN